MRLTRMVKRCRKLTFIPSVTGHAVAKLSLLIKLVILAGVLSFAGPLCPAEAQQVEHIKAAFIYNFAKFVQWPPSAFPEGNALLVIGVLEQDPLAEALDFLAGKTAQGKTIAVRKGRSLGDLKKCQIVVLSGSSSTSLGSLVNLPILTISDGARNFSSLGGIINLITVEDHIKFEINLEAARRAGLTISSQLLKLAIIIKY